MKKLALAGMLVLGLTMLGGCAVVESWSKSWESDTKGLPRTIEVYSITGELLGTYEGESVRLESENGTDKVSVLMDGKRHTFYNATVIVEEQ